MKASDIKVSIVEGRVYIDMPKYIPLVISAEDKFRKGIEVGLCPKCGAFENLCCSCDNVDYCMRCEIEQSGLKCPHCDGTGIKTP